MGLESAAEPKPHTPGWIVGIERAGHVGVEVFEFEGDAYAAFYNVVNGLYVVNWIVNILGKPSGTGIEEGTYREIIDGPVAAEVAFAVEPVGDVEHGGAIPGECFVGIAI